MKTKKRKDVLIRVPETLWREIQEEAMQQNRSATGQLIHVLDSRKTLCLLCGEHDAIYCGLDCAKRGR